MGESVFAKQSDEQLIKLIKEGNRDAMDWLLMKYKYLVRRRARALFLIGGDKDDLIQEGMIGLYKAIQDYDLSIESDFSSFLSLCILRQMYSAIKMQNRKKNSPLNNYISLDAPVNEQSARQMGKGLSLIDVMFPGNSLNPEEQLIDQENTKMLKLALSHQLSSLEKEVVMRYIDGVKYTQIAKELNKSPKAIDNALHRIKVKLTKIVKEMR